MYLGTTNGLAHFAMGLEHLLLWQFLYLPAIYPVAAKVVDSTSKTKVHTYSLATYRY